MLPPILIGCFLLFIIFVFYSYYYDQPAVIKRAVREANRTPINSVEEGAYICIEGKVEAVGPLHKAPISGRSCIAYRVVVEETKAGGYKRSSTTKTIFDEENVAAFIIRDDSGAAFIVAAGKGVHWAVDRKYKTSLFRNAGRQLEKFLAARNQQSMDPYGVNRKLSCEEGILEVGETVAVMGYGTWRQDELPEELQGKERLLRIEPGKETVYITDATPQPLKGSSD